MAEQARGRQAEAGIDHSDNLKKGNELFPRLEEIFPQAGEDREHQTRDQLGAMIGVSGNPIIPNDFNANNFSYVDIIEENANWEYGRASPGGRDCFLQDRLFLYECGYSMNFVLHISNNLLFYD